MKYRPILVAITLLLVKMMASSQTIKQEDNVSRIPIEFVDLKGEKIYLKSLDDYNFEHHDPSNIIKYNGLYYMWYTEHLKKTSCWEGGYIILATSEDGTDWKDRGIAIPKGIDGEIDDLAAITSYIVPANGKFCLFYTAFGSLDKKRKGITYALGDTPDGPWKKSGKKLFWPSGNVNEWDGLHIDDANIIFYKNNWYFYYKGKPAVNGKPGLAKDTKVGVATSENLLGPYKKYKRNPVFPGHAFTAWVHRGGVAAFGFGTFWSEDGLHFEKATEWNPGTIGLFCPENFGNGENYHGVSWGIVVMKPKGKARHLNRLEVPLSIK